MSSTPTTAEIAADARWLAQALDGAAGVVRLVAMTPADYRSASFLDDRLFERSVETRLAPWSAVAEAAARVGRDDARWIFHIGHVGSTLVARLLGELPTVLSVREPRFLRDLAALGERRTAYLAATRALFSRSFGDGQAALVKATSFVSEIAADLMPIGGQALFMTASPRNYIATTLAGKNSVRELHALAAERTRRMQPRIAALPPPANAAELAAAAWACEATALEAAAAALPRAHIRWIDFDRMLADVPGNLERIAGALALESSAHQLAAIARSPLLERYSKAPEHAYSASLRSELITEAAAHFGGEIDRALDLLRASAETSPLLARALGRAGED